jgi:hypothetical protein
MTNHKHLIVIAALAVAFTFTISASEFLKAPPSTAMKMIEDAEPHQSAMYCEDAIAAQRLDMLKLFFESNRGVQPFLFQLEAIRDSLSGIRLCL